MRSTRFLVLALVALILLSGCQGVIRSESPAPSGVPVDTSSPPVDPVQERETGLTRPAGVFGGQCDALFSDAELEAVMGEPLSLKANHFSDLWGTGGVIDQSGGLMCTWLGNASRVIAVVLPEAAIDEPLAEHACDVGDRHDSFRGLCGLEQVTNGILLSADVSAEVDAETVRTQRDALRLIFIERAAEQPAALVPIPAVGAWVLPPDCESVVAGADLSAIPGLGAGSTGGPGGGYGKEGPPAEFAIAGGWSPPSCTIIGEGEGVYVDFVPIGGYRWKEQEVAARSDATPVVLEGIDSAYSVPGYFEGTTFVYAFSGPNMLLFSVRYMTNAAGIATALIASLDATAVS